MPHCPQILNPAFNRVYGRCAAEPGFISTSFSPLNYGGELYVCPDGWCRVSLHVADSARLFDKHYHGWHVAYHGTSHLLAPTVLANGLAPSQAGCFSRGQPAYYFSPSIRYVSHPRYAKVYRHRDRYYQMVFQCRVNPARIWKKKSGTLPGSFIADPPIDPSRTNKELEWLVRPLPEQPAGGLAGSDLFVIYGIMVRSYCSVEDALADPTNGWWCEDTKGKVLAGREVK